MNCDRLLEQLRALPLEEGRDLIMRHAANLNDQAAFGILLADEALKTLYSPLISVKLAELLIFFGDYIQHRSSHALGLKAKGDALVQIGHFQEAIECLDTAGEEFLRLGEEGNWARSRISWITASESLGYVEEALQHAKRARNVFERLGEQYWAAIIAVNTAVIYEHMGRYQDSIQLCEYGRETFLTVTDQPEPVVKRAIAIAEANQGVTLCWLGRFSEAIQLQKQASMSFLVLGDTDLNIFVEIYMANTDYLQGYYGQALLRYQHVRNILLQHDSDSLANPMQTAELNLWLAACLTKLNRAQEACQLIEEAVKIYRQSGTSLQTSNALREYATALRASSKLPEALDALREALVLFHNGKFGHFVRATTLQQAEILLEIGADEAAYALACHIKEQVDDQNFIVHSVRAGLIMAEALLVKAQQSSGADNYTLLLEQAMLLCTQSALNAKDHHLQEEVYKSHYLLGRLFAFQGNSFKAAKHYIAAIIQIERILHTLAFDLSPSFLHSAWAVYEAMVVLCLQQAQAERAFSYLERARSVALSQYLTQASAQYNKLSQQDEIAAHPELQANKTTALRIQYELKEWQEKYHSYSALLVNFDPSVSSVVQQDIIQAEMKRCETKISELFELYHLYQSQPAIPLTTRSNKMGTNKIEQVEISPIQQKLTSDQLLLAYFLHKGTLIIFAVTKEQFTVYEHPGGATQLEQLLPFLYAYLQPHGWPNIDHPPQQGIQGLLKKLYDLLIAPVEAFLPPSAGHITIVPYGPLHKLPFHALYNGQNFLIENFQISYLPASNLFRHFSTQQEETPALSSQKSPVVFGFSGHGHLKRCIDEARSLTKILQGRCFLEKEASIIELVKQAPGSPLVHIATHGHARLDAPNFSSVRLADGYLNAIDAFSLDLRNCQLVTLSGCETGLSLSGGGDEQLGLGRAFLAAGARSMVISLWPVEDQATNELMQDFYQNMLKGESKMQALRTAQCSLLHSSLPAHSHPYFWAAFRLVGDPGPLIF